MATPKLDDLKRFWDMEIDKEVPKPKDCIWEENYKQTTRRGLTDGRVVVAIPYHEAEWRYVQSTENPADVASRGTPHENEYNKSYGWMRMARFIMAPVKYRALAERSRGKKCSCNHKYRKKNLLSNNTKVF